MFIALEKARGRALRRDRLRPLDAPEPGLLPREAVRLTCGLMVSSLSPLSDPQGVYGRDHDALPLRARAASE